MADTCVTTSICDTPYNQIMKNKAVKTEKRINLAQSVYALTDQYPEIVDIMREAGFQDIVKPGMLQTVGRFMTIPKGAGIKGIDLDLIKSKLEAEGFVIGEG